MDWHYFKAATLALARIAAIDQGQVLDPRVAALEAKLDSLTEPSRSPTAAITSGCADDSLAGQSRVGEP